LKLVEEARGKAEKASAPDAKDAPLKSESLSNQELRTLKKTLQSTERKMATMQGKIDDATRRLHDADPTDFVALGEIQRELEGYQAQLEELETIWLETSMALE